METKELTQDQRIAIIRHAHLESKRVTPTKSIEDFIADIKSDEVFQEHGLLNTPKEDVDDESQFLFTDSAEKIDEEDETVDISDEMKGAFN